MRARHLPGADRRTPLSTYRFQLGEDLTFDDAAERLDHLVTLGITDVYLSPILEAAPGSTHGYDVVDHGRISAVMGGREAFERLAAAAHARGLGVIVDVVPNHMAVPTPVWHNRALWSVLAHGPESPYAAWFDVDWSTRSARAHARPRQADRRRARRRRAHRGHAGGPGARRRAATRAPLLRPRLPDPARDRVAPDRGARRPPALPPCLLAGGRRGAQLPAVLRRRHARGHPGGGPDGLLPEPRPPAGALPSGAHRRLPDRPPRRAGRSSGLPRPARRGDGWGLGSRGEDPRVRRGAPGRLGGRRHHRVRRDVAHRIALRRPRGRRRPERAHAAGHRGLEGRPRGPGGGGQAAGRRGPPVRRGPPAHHAPRGRVPRRRPSARPHLAGAA